jgi:hypothetical protein
MRETDRKKKENREKVGSIQKGERERKAKI